MLNEGKGIALSHVIAAAVLVGGIGYVVVDMRARGGSSVPAGSWVAAGVLAVAAVLVLAAGLPVRRFLRGRAERPLDPIKAARTLALAQASAVTGAVVAGWYAAVVVHLLRTIELASSQSGIWETGACALAAASLAAAGLVVQRWCRVDPPVDSTGGVRT